MSADAEMVKQFHAASEDLGCAPRFGADFHLTQDSATFSIRGTSFPTPVPDFAVTITGLQMRTEPRAAFRRAIALALADTIAALKKDAERLDWLDKHPREATIRVGTDMKACVFYGVSCDPKWTMREAIDAAIDAAQSTEGER